MIRLQLVANTHKTFGSIDILVAICGSPKWGTFADITDEDLTAAFAATVVSLARMVRLVVPHMQAKKWGRVVTVQPRSVRETIPELFASNSTRPGAAGLMKDMSREFGGDGIPFNTIVPGRISVDKKTERRAPRFGLKVMKSKADRMWEEFGDNLAAVLRRPPMLLHQTKPAGLGSAHCHGRDKRRAEHGGYAMSSRCCGRRTPRRR